MSNAALDWFPLLSSSSWIAYLIVKLLETCHYCKIVGRYLCELKKRENFMFICHLGNLYLSFGFIKTINFPEKYLCSAVKSTWAMMGLGIHFFTLPSFEFCLLIFRIQILLIFEHSSRCRSYKGTHCKLCPPDPVSQTSGVPS